MAKQSLVLVVVLLAFPAKVGADDSPTIETFLTYLAPFQRIMVDTDQEAGHHELRTLAQYPKVVREAILVMLNQPKLLQQLAGDNVDLDKALKGRKPEVAAAARIVAKYPKVLMLLIDHPEALALAGKAYADDKKKAIDFLDQEESDHQKGASEWSLRLEGDQVALEEIQKAAAAYAKRSGTSLTDTGISSSGNEIIVHSKPAPAFVSYVMDEADSYPALSNVMVSQWLSSRNSAAYDRTFHHWWNRYHMHFHDSLLHPDKTRFHRLAELARYDRRFAHIEWAHRYDKFHEHAKDFPHLTKLPPRDSKYKALELHQKPDHRDSHAPGKDPFKPVHKGKHATVHLRPPSHDHHMHHAHAGHLHHIQHHGGKKK
jgi:hypothetical protein